MVDISFRIAVFKGTVYFKIKVLKRLKNILIPFLPDIVIKPALIPDVLKHPKCNIFMCFIPCSRSVVLLKLKK